MICFQNLYWGSSAAGSEISQGRRREQARILHAEDFGTISQSQLEFLRDYLTVKKRTFNLKLRTLKFRIFHLSGHRFDRVNPKRSAVRLSPRLRAIFDHRSSFQDPNHGPTLFPHLRFPTVEVLEVTTEEWATSSIVFHDSQANEQVPSYADPLLGLIPIFFLLKCLKSSRLRR